MISRVINFCIKNKLNAKDGHKHYTFWTFIVGKLIHAETLTKQPKQNI